MKSLENERESAADRRFWARRVSLTTRILAVNSIALALLAGSFFYLDSYRKQLHSERLKRAQSEVEIIADALASATPAHRKVIIAAIGSEQKVRLRLYDARGALVADSFALAPPSFTFIDPATEPWYQDAARWLDRGMDLVIGSLPAAPYVEAGAAPASAWPEIAEALKAGGPALRHRAAPDMTPVFTAATPVGTRGEALLAMRNEPDLTQSVRDARQTLTIVVTVALLISVQLSLFLARTIVQPLRSLVRAAVRVRLGRERAVVVPRLPDRRDEIGLLARALSDMSLALRQRIDAVESFAADVAHEIKNPLASLRSALESLEKVEDPALRQQLTAIAAHDVRRIDRLVTEIADASRIDAELSRTTFKPLDLAALARELVDGRAKSGVNGSCQIELRTAAGQPCVVLGHAPRLHRVFENLLDNAVSFSPPGGTIVLGFERADGRCRVSVIDDGPGIPQRAREKVFERFHSLRPEEEDFGSHSGLGLAIARTIVAAHDGTLTAMDRPDGQPGACLVIDLPEPEEPEE